MTTLICPIFYFFALYDSHVFAFEFNKRLECSKSPMKTILLPFNLSNKKIAFYYLCLLSSHSFVFLFFFLFHVIFAHDVPLEFFPCLWFFPLTFA